MFRTIVVRSNILRGSLKKYVRVNLRSFSFQVSKLRHCNTAAIKSVPHHHLPCKTIRNYSNDNLPAFTRVALPALSPTMELGTIVSWAKKEGDKLSEGDLLAEIETDKATMGFETPEEGYLAKILIPAGSKNVPVGKLVCIIVENEADVAAFKNFEDDASGASPPAAPARAKSPSPPPKASSPPPAARLPSSSPSAPVAPAGGEGERVYASPMAKRLAEQRNIRLQGKGSGLYDSITSKDLGKLAGAQPTDVKSTARTAAAASPGSNYIDIPVTNIRDVIARRLLQSKQSIPHYYVTVDVNVDNILEIRQTINKKLEKTGGGKVSVNDCIIKAAAMACKKVPEVNSSWMDTVIRQYNNVDVSVAVSTDKGLITPIIFEANNKGILAISKEVKELAGKAKEGKLKPAEFQGGTISISNLGMFGVTHFTAIINPPQSCILAIGTTQTKLVPDHSEKGFKESQFMSVTLSSDHRIVDGAIAANWLAAFKEHLEDPVSMIF